MHPRTILAACLATLVPLAARADDSWSGSGELGFAAARGNTKSENLDAKLQFKQETDRWKNTFYLNALRSKGEVKTTTLDDSTQPPTVVDVSSYQLTANRYEGGTSIGYKLDPRSYLVGTLRYEHDDFSPYDYQAVATFGYGYTVLKTPTDELSFEAGAGYKRERPIDTVETVGEPPVRVVVQPGSEGEPIGRGHMAYKHDFNDSTSLVDTLLVEAGSDNTFLQNDAGLQVSMSKKLALKVGYQVRRNSDVVPGTKTTDQLVTTNLVYKFGK